MSAQIEGVVTTALAATQEEAELLVAAGPALVGGFLRQQAENARTAANAREAEHLFNEDVRRVAHILTRLADQVDPLPSGPEATAGETIPNSKRYPLQWCVACGTDIYPRREVGTFACGACTRVNGGSMGAVCGAVAADYRPCILAPGHSGDHSVSVVPKES